MKTWLYISFLVVLSVCTNCKSKQKVTQNSSTGTCETVQNKVTFDVESARAEITNGRLGISVKTTNGNNLFQIAGIDAKVLEQTTKTVIENYQLKWQSGLNAPLFNSAFKVYNIEIELLKDEKFRFVFCGDVNTTQSKGLDFTFIFNKPNPTNISTDD